MADISASAENPSVEVAPAAAAAAASTSGGATEHKKKGGAANGEPAKILAKPEPVEQPDEEAKNKNIEACKKRIAANDKRIEDIRRTIEKQTSDRKEHGDNSESLRVELRTLRERSGAVRARRSEVFAELQKNNEARKAAQTKLRELQKTLKVGSLAEIDGNIAKIEYEMSTSTLSAKEEKAMMLEIKNLKASREQVKSVQALSATVGAMHADVDTTKTNQELLKDLDQELSTIRNREKEITDQLEQLRAKYQTSAPALPDLHKEIKALSNQNKETRNQIRQIEQDFGRLSYQYRQFQRELREYKRQQDQIKYEQRQKEREERKKEREAEEKAEEGFKETPTHPWAAEIFICDDLIKFCKAHVPKKESTSTKKHFEAPATSGLIPIGKLVSGKDDENEWAGTKTKKRGGKAEEGAAAAEPAAVQKQDDKKLTLSMDCYSGFITVNVKPPVYASQCAATIQLLNNAKSHFNSLTEADKKKQKETAAAANKAEKDAKKREAKTPKAGGEEGIPAAAVSERTGIDFRSAIRGVKGAHV